MKDYIEKYLFLVRRLSSGYLKLVVLFLLTAILDLIGIGLIGPFVSLSIDNSYSGGVFAYFSENKLSVDLNILGLSIILIFLIKGIASFFVQRRIISFSMNVGKDTKVLLMQKYFNTDYFLQEEKESSKQVNLINNYSHIFASETLMQSLRLASDSIVMLVILVLLFSTSIIYAFSFLILFTFILLAYGLFVKEKIKNYGKVSTKSAGDVIELVQNSIDGRQELKVYQKENIMLDDLVEVTKIYANSLKKYLSLKVVPKYLMEFTMVFFVVSIVLLNNDDSTQVFSTLSIFAVAAIRVIPTANQMIVSTNSMRFSVYVLDGLYKEFLEVNQVKEDSFVANEESVNTTPEKFESLELRSVSFSYPGQKKYIIKNLNIKINKGDVLGIMGPSGSGKSTLVKILLGLLKPTHGKVYINNHPMDYNKKDYLKYFAYIPQNILLMNKSIEENILFGDCLTQDNRKVFYESIEKSHLNKVVSNLEKGVHTIVGDSGSKISGGQGQRIGLARAFYHEREVFVFDEATSSLDVELEDEILKHIQQLDKSNTSIIISHNPSVVNYCNKVCKL